jgi:serine/threonine protein kinase
MPAHLTCTSRSPHDPERGAREDTNLIGRTLAHYRITAAIGAGGMGEVYRGRDTKLDREVAIKLLPTEMARNARK